jgi:hypothetical protein
MTNPPRFASLTISNVEHMNIRHAAGVHNLHNHMHMLTVWHI